MGAKLRRVVFGLDNRFRPPDMWNTLEVFICLNLIAAAWTLTPLLKQDDTRPLCPCGSSTNPLQTRVVGGQDARPGTFPYATGLLNRNELDFGRQWSDEYENVRPYCGGTLISDRHILTAAHCVRDRLPENIELDIGDYDLRKNFQIYSFERGVRGFIKHPKYVSETFKNDIAIIEASKPVVLNSKLKAAWLPPPYASLSPGTQVTVYGWGRLEYGGSRPNLLQSLDIPVISQKQCQSRLSTHLTRNMLCAGGEEGKDACIGDSGSGLTVRIENENVLAGVVSFGKKCALPGVAGVYTKVSHFVNWIYENTKNSSCQPCIASPNDFQ